MEWKEPFTKWAIGDIPEAKDFNRIEGNVQAINNEKEPLIIKLPMSRGGTNAADEQKARQNLGLGECATKNFKKLGYPQHSYGMLEFITKVAGNTGFIKSGPRYGSQIYWGSSYVGENKSTNINFAETYEETPEATGFINGNYAVITGILSDDDDNDCSRNENRNGIFIFNKNSNGFSIYNDGKSGTVYWLAIGMDTNP